MRDAMFVRPTNPVSHRLARMAFIMSCVAALIVASAGPLHRYLGLEIEPAFTIFRYGFYVAVAGAALGLATVVPTRPAPTSPTRIGPPAVSRASRAARKPPAFVFVTLT